MAAVTRAKHFIVIHHQYRAPSVNGMAGQAIVRCRNVSGRTIMTGGASTYQQVVINTGTTPAIRAVAGIAAIGADRNMARWSRMTFGALAKHLAMIHSQYSCPVSGYMAGFAVVCGLRMACWFAVADIATSKHFIVINGDYGYPGNSAIVAGCAIVGGLNVCRRSNVTVQTWTAKQGMVDRKRR